MGAFLISLQLRWQAPDRRGRRPTRTWLSMLLAGVIVVAPLLVLPVPSSVAAPLNDCVAADNGDPVLTSFERAPAEVDVSAARTRIRVLRLEVDDLGGPGPASGADTVWVGFGETPNFDEVDFIPTARLVGNAAGAWVGSIVVPRRSRPGTVRLGVFIADRDGNVRSVDAPDLAAAGFASRVTVVSTADRTPPRLGS